MPARVGGLPILPVGVALTLAMAAVALYVSKPWIDDERGVTTAAVSRSQEAAAGWLNGPDEIRGSAYVITTAGTEPATLIRNAPLAVVATVQAAEIVDQPKEIPASLIPCSSPAPGEIPKGECPTGIVKFGLYSSRYSLRVEEFIKADVPGRSSTLDLLTLGATVDARQMGYENVPVYRVGERYLIFLKQNNPQRPEEGFGPVSGSFGTYLLKDGRVYRPLGHGNSWIPYEERADEGDLVQFLRDAPKEPVR